jgi:hypothetical protein
MSVCKMERADLVLWPPQEIAVISIHYDASVWQELLSNAVYFYKKFMIPALVKICKKNKIQVPQQVSLAKSAPRY